MERHEDMAVTNHPTETAARDQILDFQIAQLIGYSLHGFAELDYVSNATYETAYRMAENNETQEQAQIRYLEDLLQTVREPARSLAAMLFRVHPDDLHT